MNYDHEKHYNTKLPITLGLFAYTFEEWTDNQRLEVIKSLIWTAPCSQIMHEKAKKLLNSEKFELSID